MPTIRLFFRKRRADVKFVSIENSFATMMSAFPKTSKFSLVSFESNFESNSWRNRWRAIREVRNHVADVNHITGDVHFLVFGLPKSRTILTIHDCGFLHNKSTLQRWVLWLIWLRLPIARCRIVTTVSEATKQDILRLVPCKPKKIVVVPTVINTLFERRDKVFNKKKPTILHIGITENKNLKRHIVALRGLSCTLHIIGKISDDVLLLLKNNQITFKNSLNLTDEEVFEAYIEADILLFCSTLEGFGMPILEAQTVGRAVVTSNVSAMPEVAGAGACLVDPLSISAIRGGVERVISDDFYRESLISAGFDNIKRFQADSVARQYEALYLAILS